MTRVLIYEPSYRRLANELEGLGFEPVLMAQDGEMSLNGAPISVPDAALEAGWANGEVFLSPVVRPFSVALLKSPTLKWLQSGAAGFDHPMFGQFVQRGVRLTTSHGQSLGMAEYVLAGVLDHFQKGPERRAAQAASDWRRIHFREINGSHWLIIGFGAIGQGVAARARSFGARITGVRRDVSPHPLADALAPLDKVPDLLPQADVVVLSTPLTAATRHMVDAAFLAAMKPGSVLVNVGRGGLVDEAALLAALDRGVPEHPVLDVFETEPLPADSPFWRHPRVAVSAHTSGETDGQSTRNDATFVENLKRFLGGEPLIYEADPKDVLGA